MELVNHDEQTREIIIKMSNLEFLSLREILLQVVNDWDYMETDAIDSTLEDVRIMKDSAYRISW